MVESASDRYLLFVSDLVLAECADGDGSLRANGSKLWLLTFYRLPLLPMSSQHR